MQEDEHVAGTDDGWSILAQPPHYLHVTINSSGSIRANHAARARIKGLNSLQDPIMARSKAGIDEPHVHLIQLAFQYDVRQSSL